jgi:hypothetical protein
MRINAIEVMPVVELAGGFSWGGMNQPGLLSQKMTNAPALPEIGRAERQPGERS